MIPFVNHLLEAYLRRRGARRDEIAFEGGTLSFWRVEPDPHEAVEGAPPLLLVHGLGDSALTWTRVVGRLPRRAPVFAMDLPPFGRSSLPEAARVRGFCTIGDEARAVGAMTRHLLEQTGARPLVAAHSLGAWAALKHVETEPDAFAGLVAISGAGIRYEGIEDLARLEGATTREKVLEIWADMWHTVPRFLPRFAAEVAENMKRPAIRGLIRSVTQEDLVEARRLPREMRLWIVWGASDRLVPLDAGRRLAEVTGAPLTVLPECGHVPQMEQPQLLAAALVKVWRTWFPDR